jgi:hypothetical protein
VPLPGLRVMVVDAADGAALVLDEEWMRTKMRLALGIRKPRWHR